MCNNKQKTYIGLMCYH